MNKPMNTPLASVLVTMILFISAMAMQAQQVGRPSGNRQLGREQQRPPIPDSTQMAKMVSELSAELSLTEDQAPAFSKVVFTHFDEVKALTANDKRPAREQMETLRKSFEKEVADMLTKDQNVKFKAYMKKNFPDKRPPERR